MKVAPRNPNLPIYEPSGVRANLCDRCGVSAHRLGERCPAEEPRPAPKPEPAPSDTTPGWISWLLGMR